MPEQQVIGEVGGGDVAGAVQQFGGELVGCPARWSALFEGGELADLLGCELVGEVAPGGGVVVGHQ